MRIRKQSATGDMVFGGNQNSFYKDAPEAVAQLVLTRLKLWLGEWFADTSDGIPYSTRVLGRGTTSTYDAVIRARILQTQGVVEITKYSSSLVGRQLTVNAQISTLYGTATVSF